MKLCWALLPTGSAQLCKGAVGALGMMDPGALIESA